MLIVFVCQISKTSQSWSENVGINTEYRLMIVKWRLVMVLTNTTLVPARFSASTASAWVQFTTLSLFTFTITSFILEIYKQHQYRIRQTLTIKLTNNVKQIYKKNVLKTVHCRNQQDFTTSKSKRWMYIIWFPIIQIQVCSIFHSNWSNTSVQSSSVKLVSLSLQFNISVTLSGSCAEHENPNWQSFYLYKTSGMTH